MFDCRTQSKSIELLEYDYRTSDWLRWAAYAKAIKQAVSEHNTASFENAVIKFPRHRFGKGRNMHTDKRIDENYSPRTAISPRLIEEDFAWWRFGWWRDGFVVARLPGGEVTGYLLITCLEPFAVLSLGSKDKFLHSVHWLSSFVGFPRKE